MRKGGEVPGPAKEKILQGSPAQMDRDANLVLHRRQIYHQMNPEAEQSPLPLPGAESLGSTGLPLKSSQGPPISEPKEPGGSQVGGKTENQRVECPDLRPESSGNLKPAAGIEPGASPVGTQAE